MKSELNFYSFQAPGYFTFFSPPHCMKRQQTSNKEKDLPDVLQQKSSSLYFS